MAPESASGIPPTPLVVDHKEAGSRLDVFVARHVDGLSRARVQHLIRDGHVTVDGEPAKPGLALRQGVTVVVAIPAVAAPVLASEPLPLTVLYSDTDLAVVDKPAGMVVHPAAGHASGTLVNALLHHLTDLSGVGGRGRPGIVHRLDKGTSGVMVIAKNDRAHLALSQQFHDRLVRKEYLALVWGRPSEGHTFDRALGRDPKDRKKISGRAVRARTAETTVEHVEPFSGVSLVALTIGTGRTHQIRVHLSEAGFPVVGDDLYGGIRKSLPPALAALGRIERPFLHAHRLEFRHPADGRTMRFEAPVPEDLSSILATLRRRVAAQSS